MSKLDDLLAKHGESKAADFFATPQAGKVGVNTSLNEALRHLQNLKTDDRNNPQNRYIAVAITDLEKLQAYVHTFLSEETNA